MTAAALLLAASVALRPIDLAGYKSLIEDHHGKVVLVNFWATWCAPCRTEMPALAALEKKLRGRGVLLITISADDPEQRKAAAGFLRRSKVSGAAYLKQTSDDDAFIRGVSDGWSGALPATFLYDPSGRMVRSFIGEAKMENIEGEVLKLLVF